MTSQLPSITIAPPEEDKSFVKDDDGALPSNLNSFGALYPSFGPMPSSSQGEALPTNYSQLSSLSISGGGLKDPQDVFFAYSDGQFDHGQPLSPLDWSPVSTSSGDLPPDSSYSDWSTSAPPSHPSSPSLSPLQTAFDDFGLQDDGPFSFPQRTRSVSLNEGSFSSLPENGRPRSASIGDLETMQNMRTEFSLPFGFPFDNGTLLSPDQGELHLCPDTGLELEPLYANDNVSSSHRRSASLSSLGGESTSPTYLAPPSSHHGEFLEVPSLQRRNAHHRRSHTHTGINAGAGRGRSLEPRSSRSPSPALPNIYLDTSPFALNSSSPNSPLSSASSTYSYSPSSPASSLHSNFDASLFSSGTSTPDFSMFSSNDPGIGRRNTYPASMEEPPPEDHLHRSASDPYPHRRKHVRTSRRVSGAGVFRSEVDRQPSEPNSAGSSSQTDGLYSPDSSQDVDFKRTVASNKIVSASEKRRKHVARFECPICEQKFTARHNLQNHLNSHNGVKLYQCKYCGQKATTSAVCTRHELYACKQNPNKNRKK